MISLQEALLKSNEVFETFKQEINKVQHLSYLDFLVLYPFTEVMESFRRALYNIHSSFLELFCYFNVLHLEIDGKISQGAQKGKCLLEE